MQHDDQIFVARFKRLVMNDSCIPDYFKVDDMETITSRDMESAGFKRNKFRFDKNEFTWNRKEREKSVLDNPECREKVREVFSTDDYTVFSDRTREVINYQGEEISTRYLRYSLDVLARQFLAENPTFPGSLRSVKLIVHTLPFIKRSGESNRVHSTCGVHKRLDLFCDTLNKSSIFKTNDWTPNKLTRIACCPGMVSYISRNKALYGTAL